MRLLAVESPQQTIELYDELGSGLVLVLDGMVQLRESEEHRYHECLAVVPLLFGPARRVFIGGGGDGLCAARLLRFEEVEAVTLCDYDRVLTEVCRTQADFTRLNAGALDDPRVRVVNEDAWAWLRETDERFDLVIGDFPDAFYGPLGRLYSRPFYELVRERLAPGGLFVTQTLAVPACARMIQATLGEVFASCRFYKHGPHGFTLASDRPLERVRSVPDWTRFLTDAFVERLFVLSKEETEAFEPRGAPAVDESGRGLVKEAVLHVHGRLMAYPFEDKPGALLVELGAALLRRLEDRTALLLAALHEQGELAVLLEDGAPAELEEAAVRLGYEPAGVALEQAVGPLTAAFAEQARAVWRAEVEAQAEAEAEAELTQLDAFVELASAGAEVAEPLAGAALAPALVAAGGAFDPSRRALLLVARGSDGAPRAIWRVGHALDGVALDCLALEGGDRVRRLSLLLALQYLVEMRYHGYTLRQPTA
jgi:spermidine synthase